MGNLPRSRPGRRSEKRSGAKKPTPKAKTQRGGSASAATGRKAGSAKSTGSASPESAGRKAAPSTSRGPDPVGDAMRIAAKVAGAGVGVAAGILKRLPRP
jgi:hypothetical protein